LCTQHIFAPVPSLREKIPTIPPQVEEVVSIALAKDPKQRFGSILAFATALEQASRATEPTVFAPQSEPPPISSPSRPQTNPPLIPTALVTPPADRKPTPERQIETPKPYLPQEKLVASPYTSEEVKAWGIGKQQLLAMLIGTAIYGFVTYLVDILYVSDPNGTSPLFSPFFNTNLANVLSSLTFIVLFFFATKFGPWTGLVCALFGALIGDSLSKAISVFAFPWYDYVIVALVGFTSGLAFLRTRGRYTTRGNTVIAMLTSFIALVVNILLLAFGNSLYYHQNFGVTFSFFVPFTLTAIVALLLMPLVLLIYNKSQ
jgi:uncharacterized membrane protein